MSFNQNLNTTIPANTLPPTYIIEVAELQGIAVEEQGVNLKTKVGNFIVSGSTKYNVKLNGTNYQFEFNDIKENNLDITLEEGLNTISISGETLCLGTIEKKVLLNDFTIYPNPTYNSINILNKDFTGAYQVEIFDMHGRLVFTNTNNNESNIINLDVSSVQKGMYFCRMISENKSKIEFKFLKK